MTKEIKIYGNGWVGKAMHTMFPDAKIQDPQQNMFAPNKADIAFVCVPTPNVGKGRLDCSIVEDVVRNAQEDLLVIRSTVMPGTTDRLIAETGKRIVMQPEYLGETVNHPMTDQKERPFYVVGGEPSSRRSVIELYHQFYNANTRIVQTSAYEAEVIKLSENRAISFKVAECQELYDACETPEAKKHGVDYYTVRDAVYGADPRFNMFWTFIYPDKRGMNSKCIPKDVYAWAAWAESMGYDPKITNALLEKNEEWLKSQ